MRVVIVEDEAVAAERLKKMLEEVAPDFSIGANLGSVKESVKWFTKNQADLIFLDIQLSDGISFSIFEQVQVNTPVIFTTAYDQYSIKAFELNSIAYLLKPIRKEDLTLSLQKYKSVKSVFTIDFESLLSEIKGTQPEFKKRFIIQIGQKIRMVETAAIAWFNAIGKNVFIKTFDGQSYPLEFSLDKLETQLNPNQFFRINRKYIVNLNAIENMTAWSRSRIKLKLNPPVEDETETVVSVDRSPVFKKWLDK
ncbi:LytR/AlgR family response regulator transcription factor [Maribellus maritimus]|uniref:LytR/AlgR family response regulator transcription factor n=1 Tax=Maribellus maritimus TaxID=2870838 RepID=UPI001EECB8C8|nr:LytTR family DNA-binding domain-containing protein [Maribellus maritimus]MCG6188919.1 LytTR family DNA-binding domain-containing protein [Maribellus maritimus]